VWTFSSVFLPRWKRVDQSAVVLGKPFTCGRSQGFDEVEIVVSRKGRAVPQVGGKQWQLGFDVSAFPIPAHERIHREAVPIMPLAA